MSRTQDIARQILETLAGWDEPADEAVLHHQINARIAPAALFSEFSDAINLCEQMRWITGTRNELKGLRWSITDKGRAARHQ